MGHLNECQWWVVGFRGAWKQSEADGAAWPRPQAVAPALLKKELKRESLAQVLLIKDLNTSIGVEMKR